MKHLPDYCFIFLGHEAFTRLHHLPIIPQAATEGDFYCRWRWPSGSVGSHACHESPQALHRHGGTCVWLLVSVEAAASAWVTFRLRFEECVAGWQCGSLSGYRFEEYVTAWQCGWSMQKRRQQWSVLSQRRTPVFPLFFLCSFFSFFFFFP